MSKVHYIQAIVAKAEIENFEESMSTERASTLGNILVEYKQNLLKDAEKAKNVDLIVDEKKDIISFFE